MNFFNSIGMAETVLIITILIIIVVLFRVVKFFVNKKNI